MREHSLLFRSVVVILTALFLSACVAAPTLEPGERPTPTPIADAPHWIQAAEPVTVSSAHEIRHLGRLEAPAPPSTVFDYALSPDSTRLAALNNDFLVVWDLLTGDTVFTASRAGANRVFYSPDKDEILLLYPDGTLAFWDADTGAQKDSLPAHEAFNGTAAYFADGGWLALGGSDGSIKVWDVVERVSLVTLTAAPPDTLTFSPDGSQLAAAYPDSPLALWDWRERQVLREFDTPGQVSRLVMSGDQRYLAGLSRSAVVVWDVQSGNSVAIPAAGSVLRFIPDSAMIAAGDSAGNIQLWQASNGQAVVTLPQNGTEGNALAVSPDGDLAFAAAYNSGVKLWSLENLDANAVGQGAFSMDNPHILDAAWTADGFLVLFFDARGPVEVWGIGGT